MASIPARFADQDFYQILGINKTATTTEITKAYRRLALRVHPDVNHSDTATTEFQYLSHIHETLSDERKRKRYDARGDVEEEDGGCGDTFDSAYAHWRSVFPSITRTDIEAFRTTYINSREELEDLIEAYEKYEGDMKFIVEAVPFADADNVHRLAERLRSSQVHAKFTKKYLDGIVRKLRTMESKEAKEAEEQVQKMDAKERKLLKSSSSSDHSGLAALIQQRQVARASAFDALAAKYTNQEQEDGDGEFNEPSEEEFAALQRKIVSRGSKPSSSRSTSSRHQPTKTAGGFRRGRARSRDNKENVDTTNE